MSEFLDNQEVTGEMLNNIALDLGAAEFNKFGTEKFGVSELNSITGDLTEKGILNIGNKCKLSLNDLVLSIGTGVIVFDDGAKLRIEEIKTVNIPDAENSYFVYAVNDTVNNKITLEVASEERTVGDFLLLCVVEAGVLKDKRIFSRSRLLPVGATQIQKIKIGGSIGGSSEGLISSVQLNNITPSLIIFKECDSSGDMGSSFNTLYTTPVFIYYVVDNIYLFFYANTHYDVILNHTYGSEELYPVTCYDEDLRVRVSIENGCLALYGKNYDDTGTSVFYEVEII